jgi:chaperonin cofactor prefoldin
MGGMMQSYSYDQKNEMIEDLKGRIEALDIRINTAKRHGDNATARTIEKDRNKVKKQLAEVKKANRDNWDSVQSDTMSMLNEMNITQ